MTSFCIETSGSSATIADAEQMAGLLRQARFELKEKPEDADIVIVNTCLTESLKTSPFLARLQQLKNEFPYKIIIIAGCFPNTDVEELAKYPLVGTRQIHRIVEVVEEALHNNTIALLETNELPPLTLPKVRKNPIIEIISLTRGCLHDCVFCNAKAARGTLQSYPPAEILEAARKALEQGVKEIFLGSVDSLGYGFDIGTTLPMLLRELVALPGNFKIHVGRGSPVHLFKVKQELFPLLNHEKVFRCIHLPLQSGSNRLLKEFKYGYTQEEFSRLVDELKLNVPFVTFETGVMMGFLGETETDYWDTLTLVRTLSPDILNISPFWISPKLSPSKASAVKMKPVAADIIVHRSKVLLDIVANISTMQNEGWIGWQGEIMIEERLAEKQWIGRNLSYKAVLVEGEHKLGDVLTVRVVRAGRAELRGEVISAHA